MASLRKMGCLVSLLGVGLVSILYGFLKWLLGSTPQDQVNVNPEGGQPMAKPNKPTLKIVRQSPGDVQIRAEKHDRNEPLELWWYRENPDGTPPTVNGPIPFLSASRYADIEDKDPTLIPGEKRTYQAKIVRPGTNEKSEETGIEVKVIDPATRNGKRSASMDNDHGDHPHKHWALCGKIMAFAAIVFIVWLLARWYYTGREPQTVVDIKDATGKLVDKTKKVGNKVEDAADKSLAPKTDTPTTLPAATQPAPATQPIVVVGPATLTTPATQPVQTVHVTFDSPDIKKATADLVTLGSDLKVATENLKGEAVKRATAPPPTPDPISPREMPIDPPKAYAVQMNIGEDGNTFPAFIRIRYGKNSEPGPPIKVSRAIWFLDKETGDKLYGVKDRPVAQVTGDIKLNVDVDRSILGAGPVTVKDGEKSFSFTAKSPSPELYNSWQSGYWWIDFNNGYRRYRPGIVEILVDYKGNSLPQSNQKSTSTAAPAPPTQPPQIAQERVVKTVLPLDQVPVGVSGNPNEPVRLNVLPPGNERPVTYKISRDPRSGFVSIVTRGQELIGLEFREQGSNEITAIPASSYLIWPDAIDQIEREGRWITKEEVSQLADTLKSNHSRMNSRVTGVNRSVWQVK
jgi:hypothetical protein